MTCGLADVEVDTALGASGIIVEGRFRQDYGTKKKYDSGKYVELEFSCFSEGAACAKPPYMPHRTGLSLRPG